jgi:hypothetical protein
MATATAEHATTTPAHDPAPLMAIRSARDLLATDRAATLAALAALFRSGTVPEAIAGPHMGILVTTTVGMPADRLIAAWAAHNLRWLGKRFTETGGDNIWRRYRRVGDTLFWKLNALLRWQAVADSAETYRAFPFRTAVGRGVADKECMVLKIIYDARPNPLPVRRVLDELVALGDGVYLGKAHGRLFGRWRLLAYFALVASADGGQRAAGN